jgi:hypothetical protein
MHAIAIVPPEPGTIWWGEVYVYLCIDGAPAGTRVTLAVSHPPDGFNLQIFNGTPPRHPDPRWPMEVAIQLKIPMKSLGRYELHCRLNGEDAGYTSFLVFDRDRE